MKTGEYGAVDILHQSDDISSYLLEISPDCVARIMPSEKDVGKKIIYHYQNGYGRFIFKEDRKKISRRIDCIPAEYVPHRIINDSSANPLQMLIATNFPLDVENISFAKNEIPTVNFRSGGKTVDSTCGPLRELVNDIGGVSIAYIKINPERTTDMHRHPFLEFYLVDEGSGRIVIGEHEKSITKSTLVRIPEHEDHCVINESKDMPLELIVITCPRFDQSQVVHTEKK